MKNEHQELKSLESGSLIKVRDKRSRPLRDLRMMLKKLRMALSVVSGLMVTLILKLMTNLKLICLSRRKELLMM